MARFYADENFPQPAVLALRERGHDVLTALEAGQANLAIPDAEVLAFAHRLGRALLTLNRWHFVALHSRRASTHSGLVVCSYDSDFEGLAERIDAATSHSAPLLDQLVRVSRKS